MDRYLRLKPQPLSVCRLVWLKHFRFKVELKIKLQSSWATRQKPEINPAKCYWCARTGDGQRERERNREIIAGSQASQTT